MSEETGVGEEMSAGDERQEGRSGIEPLTPTNRFSEVLARLRSLVESGDLRPGQRLPSERELALALGVNRSSVREALRALQSAGLVDIQHGRGVFVRQAPAAHEALLFRLATGDLGAELVPDLIEARTLVEGALARQAAERAEPADIATLEALTDELAAGAAQVPPSLAADTRFHLTVAKIAGNSVLEALVKVTYDLASKFFGDYVADAAEATRILAEHRAVIAQIREANGPGAEAAMRHHIRSSIDTFLEFIAAKDLPETERMANPS